MSNQVISGVSIFLAVLLHIAVFINLPENKIKLSPGAIDNGRGGFKIGFTGSVGNGLPISTVKQTNRLDIIQANRSHILPLIKAEPAVQKIRTDKIIIAAKKTNIVKMLKHKKELKKLKPIKQLTKKIITSKKQIQTATQEAKIVSKKTGTGIGSGKHKSSTRGGGRTSEGGGIKGQLQSYHNAILAWLEKHKRYPRMARRRNQQGTAILYFKIDRNGRVLNYNIRSSSGYKTLDHAASAMLQRANPLPPAPYTMSGKTMEFTLPIAFNITH